MTEFFAEAESVLDGSYSVPFGLGFECELVQRAAKAQIIKFLPDLVAQQEQLWNNREQEFIEKMGFGAYKPIKIPKVSLENIRSGVEVMSLIKAPITRWPSILVYARNASPYTVQADHFDTVSISLYIEILCKEGPFKEENVHDKEGLAGMERLDSQLQRLSDAVHMCIKKDATLCGSSWNLEKPPKVTTSLPWARKEAPNATGKTFIFQGRQFEYTVQKISS